MAQKSGETLFSPDIKGRVRQYIWAKYHPDSEDWERTFGKAETMKAFLERLVEEYPNDIGEIYKMVVPPLDPRKEAQREQLKEEQMRRDGVVFATSLPVGLPEVCGSFDTFKKRPGHRSVAEAVSAVRAWMRGEGSPMLTLIGVPGTGKSHLSTAAGKHLFDAGENLLFRREGDMMADFRKAVPQNRVEEVLQTFSTVPWLIVDDFGTASVNDSGMLGELRDRLFDYRWQNTGLWQGAIRTLVTTNLSGEQLPARIASRLRDTKWGNATIGIDAPDYRVAGR